MLTTQFNLEIVHHANREGMCVANGIAGCGRINTGDETIQAHLGAFEYTKRAQSQWHT